jgi:hypothetical protein
MRKAFTLIEQLYADAAEQMDSGSKFPGMSYKEGIMAVIDWLDGQENPMED